MNTQVIIVVNPYCRQGRGWKLWQGVKSEVYKSFHIPIKEIVTEQCIDLCAVLAPLVQQAPSTFIISAGGDGSVHCLVNSLLQPGTLPLDSIVLGAIGLGSSNDFLKPFTSKIGKVPVRIQYEGPVRRHDVGIVSYTDSHHRPHKRYFVVNASFGLTAEANWSFNHPGRVLQWLKANSTGAAILYAAFSTLVRHKNVCCSLDFNGTKKEVSVSNINVLKIPFVSGSFHYPESPQPDDGRLGINICQGMSKWALLSTMHQLEKGRFRSNDRRASFYAETFSLCSPQPVLFECDGETDWAVDVQISVWPKAIRVLTS